MQHPRFSKAGSEKMRPTVCLLGGSSKPWASTSTSLPWSGSLQRADGTSETPPLRHATGRFRFGVQRARRCGWIPCWCHGLRAPCLSVVAEGRRDQDHHGRLVVAHLALEKQMLDRFTFGPAFQLARGSRSSDRPDAHVAHRNVTGSQHQRDMRLSGIGRVRLWTRVGFERWRA